MSEFFRDEFRPSAALDKDGRIVVAGTMSVAEGGSEWIVRLYDPNCSTELSMIEYVPEAAGGGVGGIAIGKDSTIVVAGDEISDEQTGDPAWRVQIYDSRLTDAIATTSFGDSRMVGSACGVAVDREGNIFVIGTAWPKPRGSSRWIIRKYDPTLSSLLGSAEYRPPDGANAEARSVAVDESGDVVAVGDETLGVGRTQWRIVKYDGELREIKANLAYGALSGLGGGACAVTIDSSGSVIVAGWEWTVSLTGSKETAALVASAESRRGKVDWRINKYNAALSRLLASTTYDGPGHGKDQANGVAVDSRGNILVTGTETAKRGDLDWRTRVYDASLSSLVASRAHDGPAAGKGGRNDFAYSVMEAENGEIIVVGDEAGPYHGQAWRVIRHGCSAAVRGEGVGLRVR